MSDWFNGPMFPEWEAFLERIHFKNSPIPTRLAINRGQIAIYVRVPDRERGTEIDVMHSYPLPDWRPSDDLLGTIHNMVRLAWGHELDEAFHVDGVRVYDPHRHEQQPDE